MVTRRIALDWATGPEEGHIRVIRGKLVEGIVSEGEGTCANGRFKCPPGGRFRLVLTIAADHIGDGAYATRVSVRTACHPFTFFLRDVRSDTPIIIPPYGVAVTEVHDHRSFAEVLRAVRDRGLLTDLERIGLEPEESFETAAENTRDQRCPTWLGLSRDMRIFEVGLRTSQEEYDSVQPRFHGELVALEETGGRPCRYDFLLGRGWGCTDKTTRRLEEGVLPILRQVIEDGDILYDCTAFVTLERSALTKGTVRGTHFLIADAHGRGHMFTEEQDSLVKSLLPEEMNQPEETVLCYRAEAINSGGVPRYAFFKAVWATGLSGGRTPSASFDGEHGLGMFPSSRVFCASRLNGNPMPQGEVAVLIGPGEKAVFEFFLPHRPISRRRALHLSALNFDERLEECRQYWTRKLERAAAVELPEKRIENMVKAGILHLDLIAYGLEPDGPVTPTVGVYSAIGSESSPIIQFTDSMGRHELAERMLAYFLEKQHEDGFIQNLGGYMLETGCVLWSLGEHYRYTRDDAWVERNTPQVLKSCDFILDWRERNGGRTCEGRDTA